MLDHDIQHSGWNASGRSSLPESQRREGRQWTWTEHHRAAHGESWVVDAEARGDRYALVLPGLRIPPDRGPQQRHRCLAALAVFEN